MEQFANLSLSTLNGAITSGATTLVVANASTFPSTGNFRLLIDSELMLVTGVASTTFTVSRAQEGTVATGHANGATVTHIITAGGLVQALTERTSAYTSYVARPTPGNAGRIFTASDPSPVQFLDDGSTWRPLIHGVPGTEAAPNNSVAAYTTQNFQGGTTLTATGGCALLKTTASTGGNSLQGAYVARAAGQTVTACMSAAYKGVGNAAGTLAYGVYLFNSSNSNLYTWDVVVRPASNVTGDVELEGLDLWTSPTSFSGGGVDSFMGIAPNQPLWMRIRDDLTNFNAEWSNDGVNWLPIANSGNWQRASNSAFNNAGFYFDAASMIGQITVLSFKVA